MKAPRTIRFVDLPLEDLARGIFPSGATESSWSYNYLTTHEPAVVSRIKWFRTLGPDLTTFRNNVNATGTDQIGLWRMFPNEAQAYISLVEAPSVDGRYAMTYIPTATFDAKMSSKFKLKLPKWLTFERLYDAVDIENSLLDAFEIEIRGADERRMNCDMRIWRDKPDTPLHPYRHFETFTMKIHASSGAPSSGASSGTP